MRKQFLVAFVSLFWWSSGIADTERFPVPLVFASEPGGNAIFTMMPPQFGRDYKIARAGTGVAYRLNRDGKLKELYRTTGWYSFKVHVSQDGRYLVQMGPWNEGQVPSRDHLAVAFHKDGKEVKRYSTAELVKDAEKLAKSVSHYDWLAPDWRSDLTQSQTLGLQPNLDHDNRFTLHTLDGWTYVFDVTSGEIKSAEATKRQ